MGLLFILFGIILGTSMILVPERNDVSSNNLVGVLREFYSEILNMKMPIIIKLAIIFSVIFIFAICFHSLEEIHYLKSFFPQTFTVEEAFYASVVELIKIVILSIPFLLVIGLGMYFLNYRRQE